MSSGSKVVACGCGRTFLSGSALEQHHRDKMAATSASAGHASCADSKQIGRTPKSVPRKAFKGPEMLSPKDQWLAKGAGNLVDTLTSVSLELSGSEPSISSSDGHDLICSYNWVEKKQPTVYVPGGAPIFEAVSLPTTLKPDSGRHFVDQNATRLPRYPFEVVFQAAALMNPTVRFDEIDVLTNRNSLRKFFEFCKGRAQDSFRVNLHLVNDTLVIERCVRSTTEFLHGSGGSGFGHNFEKAMTRLPPGLGASSGHHRVLQYDFGGLKCAVRFEVDASYDDPEAVGETKDQLPKAAVHGEEVASLTTAFSSIAVNKIAADPNDSSVDTIGRGAGTSQASVAELKSRRDHRLSPKSEWLPQLWFGRTRYLITGHHENGTFDEVHVHDLREKLEAWEKNNTNQETLRKIAVLFARLREIARTTETRACVVICEKAVKPPVLRIYASTSGKGPLPPSMVQKFWDTRES